MERTQARMEEKEKGGGYDGTRARQREGRGCALGTEKLRGAETAATALSRTGGATASTLFPSLVVAKLA